MVIKLPIELYPRILDSPAKALRNYACVRVGGLTPFFGKEILRFKDSSTKNPLNERALFLHTWWTARNMQAGKVSGNASAPRFIHIDIGVTKDSAGICCCHVERWGNLPTRQEGVFRSTQSPFFRVDFLGRIQPEYRGGEIQIDDLKEIVYEVERRGFWVALVTFDSYQSLSTIQELNRNGIYAATMSIDATTTAPVLDLRSRSIRRKSTGNPAAAMEFFRSCLYEDRVKGPYHNYLIWESKMLEQDMRSGKVGVAPNASDDLIQAVAGAVFVAGVNRELSEPVVEVSDKMERREEWHHPEEESVFVVGDEGVTFNDVYRRRLNLDDPLGETF